MLHLHYHHVHSTGLDCFPLGAASLSLPVRAGLRLAIEKTAIERRREGLEEPALRVVEKGIYAMNG